MTAKVLKSQIRTLGGEDNFAEAVGKHVSDMNDWRLHMVSVGREPTKYVGYPPPQASPLINSAVKEVDDGNGMQHWEPDYEIVNDDPPPELMLQRKKNDLFNVVSQMEAVAAAAVLPAGKRRLFNIRHSDIVSADTIRKKFILTDNERLRLKALNEIPEAKRADPVEYANVSQKFDISEDDLKDRVEKQRPVDDTAFLQEHEDRMKQYDEIARFGAALHAEIEDLTVENIDTWKPRAFPT
jgi:hypothetical protein